METRTLELRVGAAALALGAALVFVVLWASNPSGPGPVTVFVDFPAASGLKAGSKVCISSVPIGAVVSVEAHDGRHDAAVGRRVYVRAELEFEAASARLVRQNARYTITTEGVLGERYVEITPSTEDSPPVAPGAIVVGAPSFQQEALARNSNSLNLAVNRLVRKHSPALKGAGAEASAALDAGLSAMDRVANLSERHSDDLALLRARAAATGQGVEETASALSQALDAGRGGDPVGQARATSEALLAANKVLGSEVALTREGMGRLQQATAEFNAEAGPPMRRMQAAGASVARGLGGLGSTLRSPDTSIGALLLDRELLDDILSMTKDIKRHPWKLVLNWDQ